jgi:hypothetical protein
MRKRLVESHPEEPTYNFTCLGEYVATGWSEPSSTVFANSTYSRRKATLKGAQIHESSASGNIARMSWVI